MVTPGLMYPASADIWMDDEYMGKVRNVRALLITLLARDQRIAQLEAELAILKPPVDTNIVQIGGTPPPQAAD